MNENKSMLRPIQILLMILVGLFLPKNLWAHSSAAPYVAILIGLALIVYVAHGIVGFLLAFILRKPLSFSLGEILFLATSWPPLTNAIYLPLTFRLQKDINHGWFPYTIIALTTLSILLLIIYFKKRFWQHR